MPLHHLRQNYTLGVLSEQEVDPDPIQQFAHWFGDAQKAGVREPNAMTLATCDVQGVPAARIVLLKDFTPQGFTFFTNQQSAKALDLASHPHACLLFFWEILERQVRITGAITTVSRAESEAYHRTRPRASQLAAWTSQQSMVIADRAALEAEYARLEKQYEGKDVPCPPHWGGCRLTPSRLEFWQGRPNRLHDRLRYQRSPGTWTLQRLAP